MATNLRIHISPVGFAVQRVTEALVRMQADKVYLITSSRNDNATIYWNKIKSILSKEYSHITVTDEFVDVWDLFACLEKYREIITKEAGNHIYINVSTGTKITSIAGTLACMLWGATPYYVKISYLNFKQVEPPSEHVEDIATLPTYEIKKPKQEFLTVLAIIDKYGGKIRKKELIKKLTDLEIIKPIETDKLTKAAEHSQLRAIIDPMEREWNLITVESSGRRSVVMMTEQGHNSLQIFGNGKLQ